MSLCDKIGKLFGYYKDINGKVKQLEEEKTALQSEMNKADKMLDDWMDQAGIE